MTELKPISVDIIHGRMPLAAAGDHTSYLQVLLAFAIEPETALDRVRNHETSGGRNLAKICGEFVQKIAQLSPVRAVQAKRGR